MRLNVLTGFLAMMMVIGAVLIIIGAWRWGSAEEVEVNGITDYNGAVANWTSFGAQAFEGQLFSWIRPNDKETLVPVSPPPLVEGLEYTSYVSLQYSVAAPPKVVAVSTLRIAPAVNVTIVLGSGKQLASISVPYYRSQVGVSFVCVWFFFF